METIDPTPKFWSTEALWLTVFALVLTVLLLRARRHERSVFLNTLWLFLLGIIGQACAAAVYALDFPTAAKMVHSAFRILSAIALIRMFGFGVFRLLLPLIGKQPPRIIEDLAIVVMYVIYGFVQLRGAGVDLSSIVTTSAILTAVLAFAMQDTLGNVLAGLAIQLDHSVQVGDWVRVDELIGRVRDIRWRSTLIETRNWETVVIPNSMLMKSRVAILGRREGAPLQWRRVINFMVDPAVPPARVIAIVDEEMRELAMTNVARTPAANCVLFGFESGNLRYHLRYFLTDLLEDDLTDSMVRVHLFASLQRAGIRVAEPQNTVHSIQRDEAHAETVRRRELTRRLDILGNVELFAQLSDNEKADIAERLQYAPFARGDVITKQGNTAHWLYIMAFGDAEVFYEPPSGQPQVLALLRPGQFFGEMALMTGDARTATVVAKTDVECWRLDRGSFQRLLQTRPDIAEEVKRVIGARRGDLERAREAFAATVVDTGAARQGDLLGRLRRFLGLGA
ncbi:MAG TPA: mechanosensitive ion channel family protein [Burkholderiales bacterium]|nr:mechanosensitive ion channel family protein [Burkholderiales bacterium]